MVLAPLVVGRKGEQAELFDELRAQGFVRLRVDGEVLRDRRSCRSSTEEREAHDRGRGRPAARCATDVQAAARRVVRDRAAPRRRPRARGRDGQRRASTCSPRSSPARSAATRSRSSSRGSSRSTIRWARARAATAWARSASSIRSASSPFRTSRSRRARSAAGTGATSSTSRCCSRSRSTTASTSRSRSTSCPRRVQHVDPARLGRARRSAFTYPGERGRSAVTASMPSKASCRTSSGATARPTRSSVREELAKYLNTQPCPECDGTRLRREARNVRVGRRAPIYELSALPLQGDRSRSSSALELPGLEAARSPRRSCARSSTALQFLNNVGLDYLSLDRSADTLSGRRGAAHPAREPDRLGAHRRDVRARRAVDRPAPARQRAPARDAQAPARPRQHR